MRALNKGWIGIALVVLFGASLFFFRGSSRYSNLFNSDNFVANISGTQISTTQFLRSLEMNIGQFAQMIGEELSGDQIRAFQIHQLVLQNLVNNAIFENEFDNLNFILDDSIVAKKTKERFPNLYINNKINDDVLNDFLKQQRLKIEDLVNIINYETRANVFDDLLFQINYPKELSKKINMLNNQLRKIDIITLPFEEISVSNLNRDNISKDDPELIKYFDENSSNYMSMEKRDISYISIDKNDFAADFTANENDITKYFNDNKKLFTLPEKRSFKQFNFKSKEDAENFKLTITGLANDKIISYAKDNNIIFNNFEDVDENQVLEEISNVIFSLKIDEISDVITTTLAYHIIILDNISLKRDQTLDEVYNEINDTLSNVELDNFFNNLKLKISQQILDGLSLNEIALENNLFLENIRNLVKNSENEDLFLRTLVNSSFSLNKDFVSDIFDYDNNKSYIINVNEIYPSKLETVEEVYDTLLNDYIKFKKLKFAEEKYDEEKNNQNLNKINDFFQSNINQIEIQLNSDSLPNHTVRGIFESKINEITMSSDENNIYFAKINKIQIPNESKNLQDIELIPELKNAFGNEVIKTKNISFNDELINGLLSQYK